MLHFKHDNPLTVTGELFTIMCNFEDVGWDFERKNLYFYNYEDALEEAQNLLDEFNKDQIRILALNINSTKIIEPAF